MDEEVQLGETVITVTDFSLEGDTVGPTIHDVLYWFRDVEKDGLERKSEG